MKRYIQTILMILIFTFLSTWFIWSVAAVNDQSRGVSTEISYSPDAGPPGDDSWYPDLLAHTSWLCGQHGGCFFGREKTTVDISATVCGHSASETATGMGGAGGSFTVFEDDSCPHTSLDVSLSMVATNYSGKYYRAKLGIGTDSASTGSEDSEINVYTTGITHFTPNGGDSGENARNSALAYILAECGYNTAPPEASHVQIAFWQAQISPDATSGNIQSKLYDTGNFPFNAQVTAKQTRISKLQANIAKWNLKISQGASATEAEALKKKIADAKKKIAQLEKEIKQIIASSVTGLNSKSTNLWKEATDFGEMWDRISAAGGYNNTIKDGTAKYADGSAKVSVQYDATNRQYRVGPFKVEYLERYTGSTQLCGMTGVPELTVRKDGRNASLAYGSGWSIAYNSGRNTSKYPSSYNVYPHSGEEFYIVINYQEGMECIANVKFYFRYLKASGGYTLYEGNIDEIQWTAVVKATECTSGSKCDHGSSHESSVNHGDDENPDYCSGGHKCSHGQYKHHYDNAWVEYSSSISGSKDIQDIAYCTGASRSYAGNRYGASGDARPSHVYRWNIDLTTMLAGDVWLDSNPQKTNNTVIGIKDSNDKGLENIAVTVYLYDTNGNERGTAIAHNANGGRISWPIYTNKNGHYQVDRLEAPGLGSNYFYVVKYEYDGQVYRHTVYMADRNSVSNGIAGQRYTANYKNNPNYYSTSSMAVEEVVDRYAFDQSFGEITGESPINTNDYSTKGLTYTTNENGVGKGAQGDLYYYGQSITVDSGTNKTNFIDSKLDSPAQNKDGVNKKITDDAKYTRYRMTASTYYDNTDMKGLGDRNNFRTRYPLEGWKYTMNNVAFNTGDKTKRYIDEYMLHINLGLQGRALTDISLLKDLYKVTMVVNEQKITKQFNSIGGTSDSVANSSEYAQTLKAALEKRKNSDGEYKYSFGLYSTDLSYQSYQRYQEAISEVIDLKKGTELRVYVTYVIRVYNNSETNDVEFNEVTDYYDKTYTLVTQADYESTDGSYKASIVNEKGERSKQTVADFPYYRIMSVADGASNNMWGETRAANVNGHANGDLTWVKEDSSRVSNEMNKSVTTTLDKIRIHTNQYAEIFTTYEVDVDGYKNMQDRGASIETRNAMLGDKQNVAELSSYSTFYTNVDNDGSGLYTGFKSGWVSGRVDQDSAPNNIDTGDVLNRNKYEDDTDRAIPINIAIDTYERDMYGYVWKDKKTVDTSYKMKVGNGTPDADEPLIQNVEVTMYEVINLGKFNADGSYNSAYDSFDYYYKVPAKFYNYGRHTDGSAFQNEDGVKTTLGRTTDVDGNPVDGNYYIYGYLAGDYILRFDYGTQSSVDTKVTRYGIDQDGKTTTIEENVSEYNGQDYENTKFLNGQLDTLNDKYLDLTGKIGGSFIDTAVSKARDNESRRMVVDAYSRTIENDRAEILRDRNSAEFIESTRMFAETPIMQIEIEDPRTLKNPTNDLYQEKTENDAEKNQVQNHRYTIKNINFGLEERANTDIKLEKYIESINMIKSEQVIFTATMLENGEVVMNDTNAAHLDKLTYLSHEKAGLVQQGFYSVSIEDDYLNDLTISIMYKIKVRNVSEVDFTGKLANMYRAKDIVNMATVSPTDELTQGIIRDLAADVGVPSNSTLKEILTRQDSNLTNIIDKDSNNDIIRPTVVVYGRYVGRYYYENTISDMPSDPVAIKSSMSSAVQNPSVKYPADKVVTTTVDQLVDYIDLDVSLADEGAIANATWEASDLVREPNGYVTSLNGLISKSSYRKADANGKYNIYDDKDREFINTTRSNIVLSYNERLIPLKKHREMYADSTTDEAAGRVEYMASEAGTSRYNTNLTRELLSENYKAEKDPDTFAEIRIIVSKTTSSGTDANQMRVDNLAEVLVYSNPTGRRDTNSVPGNAMAIVNNLVATNADNTGVWYAGYNSVEYWNGLGTDKSNWTQYPENDSWSPEYMTVIAPLGIALRTYVTTRIVPIVILAGTIVIMMIMFGVKQVKIAQRKDDDDLEQ